MTDVTDQDLELLDAYLDDALSTGERDALIDRLAREPALSAALEELRAGRDVRLRAFAANELSPAEAEAFAEALVSGLRKRESWRRWRRATLTAAGVAACVAIGWIGRSMWVGTEQSRTRGIVDASGTADVVGGSGAFQVILTDDAGKVLAVQKFGRLDEARQFASDLTRYQLQQEQVRQGQMVLVSDEF